MIGISADSVKAHAKFRDKYDRPFPIPADPEKKAINLFGVRGEKSMYGKSYFGILRTTFVPDENDAVLRVFDKVKPAGHAKEILDVL